MLKVLITQNVKFIKQNKRVMMIYREVTKGLKKVSNINNLYWCDCWVGI